jgi:hypothetical protein
MAAGASVGIPTIRSGGVVGAAGNETDERAAGRTPEEHQPSHRITEV